MAMTGKELAEALADFSNCYGIGATEAAEVATELVERTHPTLQQGVLRLFVSCIRKWAEQKYYDGRNEATIKLCRKIVETFDKDMYLPLI